MNFSLSDISEMTAPHQPSEKSKASGRFRFSTPGYPRLLMALGLLILVASTLLFGAIAEDVITGDPLTQVDARLSAWLHAQASARLTTLLLIVTNIHSPWGMSALTLGVSAYWWVRRLRYWVLMLMLTVFGGLLLNFLLKHLFLRPRPDWPNSLLTFTTYSFPSGHTMAATVFYGTLCAFVFSRIGGWHWRALAIILSVLMVGLVGFSRIYLGVHYLSDVLAAITEGLAWLAFSFLAVDFAKRRRNPVTGQ